MFYGRIKALDQCSKSYGLLIHMDPVLFLISVPQEADENFVKIG